MMTGSGYLVGLADHRLKVTAVKRQSQFDKQPTSFLSISASLLRFVLGEYSVYLIKSSMLDRAAVFAMFFCEIAGVTPVDLLLVSCCCISATFWIGVVSAFIHLFFFSLTFLEYNSKI